MIVCSIDLMGGKAVQLERGERLVLERDDVVALAERFGRLGEVAVIDLDAALGRGDNRPLIEVLCKVARCRVGGGIRDAERARRFLQAGAQSVILGTAAAPELLRQLPRERTIVALDARAGRVVTHGWRVTADQTPLERARDLEPYCGGFLYTDVEREGLLGGLDVTFAERLRAAVAVPLTVAGGIRGVAEIVELDRRGIDAQAGMAIYRGLVDPVDAVLDTVRFGADGLAPTIVCDAASGRPRMLAYSNRESLGLALREGSGTYWSRSRGSLWRKGETSCNVQRLVRAELDCDRDALTFYVEQLGPTCHRGSATCFDRAPFTWETLAQRVADRSRADAGRSFTARLVSTPELLAEKLREEADEVARAEKPEEVAWECADLLYFMSVKMQVAGIGIGDVMAHLAARAVDA
jgi:phosphoribosyl-ATP pyrophosphohydrolase